MEKMRVNIEVIDESLEKMMYFYIFFLSDKKKSDTLLLYIYLIYMYM